MAKERSTPLSARKGPADGDRNAINNLARWILMSQDRMESDNLPLTQEFMAQILGSRRASVTVAAGILQKAGLISCTRGSVKIADRRGLEDVACDCYKDVQRQLKDWETEEGR